MGRSEEKYDKKWNIDPEIEGELEQEKIEIEEEHVMPARSLAGGTILIIGIISGAIIAIILIIIIVFKMRTQTEVIYKVEEKNRSFDNFPEDIATPAAVLVNGESANGFYGNKATVKRNNNKVKEWYV